MAEAGWARAGKGPPRPDLLRRGAAGEGPAPATSGREPSRWRRPAPGQSRAPAESGSGKRPGQPPTSGGCRALRRRLLTAGLGLLQGASLAGTSLAPPAITAFSTAVLGGGLAAGMLLAPAEGLAQTSGALDPQAVADIARGITVRIEGATQGSGVLVERQGDQYTVLTAWHVVSGQRPGEGLAVYAPDGQEQAVLAGSLQRIGAVDLALLRFRSPNSYAVAQRAALSSTAMGSTVDVAGFPLATSTVPNRRLRFLESRVVPMPAPTSPTAISCSTTAAR